MPPANNDFANAQVITGNVGSVSGDNTGADNQVPDPLVAAMYGGGASVWYAWTAPSDGSLDVWVDASPGLGDSILGVFHGPSYGSLTVDGTNDDAGSGIHVSGTSSEIDNITVTSGTVYYIEVDGYSGDTVEPITPSDAAQGAFTLGWDFTPAPVATPIPSTATDCAHAFDISGHDTHGLLSGDFRGWAGTYPAMGQDPLWNYEHEYSEEGGGTPLWVKWTNHFPDIVVLEFDLYKGGADPTPVVTNGVKACVVKGTCGSLKVDEFADLSDIWMYQTSNIVYPAPVGTAQKISLIVKPGETAFLEIDNATDSGTYPPTPNPANLGTFWLYWVIRSVSTYDIFGSTIDQQVTLVNDVTNGMHASDVAAGNSIFQEDADSIVCNGRIYYIFGYGSQTPGFVTVIPNQWWLGSCNLDGTDYQLISLHTIDDINYGFFGSNPTPHLIPRLATDGTDVYVMVPGVYMTTNPNRSCGSGTDSVRYDMMIFVGTRASFTQVATVSTEVSYNLAGFQAGRICASSAQPGVCFVGLAYQSRRTYIATISGTCQIDTTRDWYVDHFDRYEISNTGTVTALALDNTTVLKTAYDSGADFPATSPWNAWDIINDDGYPIIAMAVFTKVRPMTQNPGFITQRFDTKAAIASFIYDDFIAGLIATNGATLPASSPNAHIAGPLVGSPTDGQNPISIRLYPKYFNEDRSRDERFLALWWGDPTTTTAKFMLPTIPSGGTNSPNGAEPGPSSYFGDPVMIGQLENCPVVGDLKRNVWGRTAQYDRLCAHYWRSPEVTTNIYFGGSWHSSGGLDLEQFWGAGYQIFNEPIIRDYNVCVLGPEYIPSLQSIFWFFKDGAWHNAGSDPSYNLWFYKDGAWRSHLQDPAYALYGQLAGTWQN